MLFEEAFARVVGHEGGFGDDQADHGNWTGGRVGQGELKGTKYGISAAAYPAEDIKNLTLARAKEIYRKDYWGPAGCDAVPDAVKFHLFDMAVNQGVKAAIKALQHAVHETEDGILGPKTLQAINSTYVHQLLFRFAAARLVAYTKADDTRWLRFGRGWIKRVSENMMGV